MESQGLVPKRAYPRLHPLTHIRARAFRRAYTRVCVFARACALAKIEKPKVW